MKVTNVKTGISYSVHFHANNKVPTYFDAGVRSVPATVDGNRTRLVLHPTRDTSNRVNFQTFDAEGKVTNCAVDNASFWDEVNAAVVAKSKATWTLVTGKPAKPEAEAEKPSEAAETATAAA